MLKSMPAAQNGEVDGDQRLGRGGIGTLRQARSGGSSMTSTGGSPRNWSGN